MLLVIAGLAAFYYFGEQARVFRVLYVLGGLIAGAAGAWVVGWVGAGAAGRLVAVGEADTVSRSASALPGRRG